jgi:hypothetical protein
LFHAQGNLPSHRFVEIQSRAGFDPGDVEDVDFDNVRLLTHHAFLFTAFSSEGDLQGYKWKLPGQ